jgi:hypothetical protein
MRRAPTSSEEKAIFLKRWLNEYRSLPRRVRLLAHALVAVIALGIYAVIVDAHESRIAVAPPHDPVLGSYAPAAKAAAPHTAPAPPKARPIAAPAPVTETTTRRPARVNRRKEVAVRPASRARTKHVAAAPEPPLEGTTGVRVSTDTPPQPAEPLVISDPRVVSLSPSSAQIAFHTNLPATTRASYGIDAPVLWTAAEPAGSLDHQLVISGLTFSTTYQVWLHTLDEYNQTQTAVVSLTTAPMSNRSVATTSADRIMVDGDPFFPIAVWAQCSDGYASNVADGINLFIGDGCGSDRQMPDRLAGRAYSVVAAKDAHATGRGVIGWYLPDEWDAFLSSTVTRDDLRSEIPDGQPGKISFLNLTNHFYSHADPLPQGRGMYPTLYSLADVLSFDLYPLQVWCKPAFGDVFDAQHELSTATGGKPTFQWIEVAPMEQPCGRDRSLDPTAATVRAESWLAVAGGADGIGYFPNNWKYSKADIGTEIARTNRQIDELSPVLLSPPTPASSNAPAVRVSARSLNGALYVIAVNTSTTETAQTRITVDGISGRSATVLGDGTVVGSDDTGFTDTFTPLAAKVYVIPPKGW